jgi:hypothetical protein
VELTGFVPVAFSMRRMRIERLTRGFDSFELLWSAVVPATGEVVRCGDSGHSGQANNLGEPIDGSWPFRCSRPRRTTPDVRSRPGGLQPLAAEESFDVGGWCHIREMHHSEAVEETDQAGEQGDE